MTMVKRAAASLGVVVVLLAMTATVALRPVSAANAAPAAPTISVTLSKTDVSLKTGDEFTFTSTITNSGSAPTPPLIANLNLVSVGDVSYVDPEDWFPNRFITIDPIAAGQSTEQSWTVHAIQGGDYSVFIVALPDSATTTAEDRVAGSPAVHVHVELVRNLNPGGVTPVAIAVPLVLGFALATTRLISSRGRVSPRENTTPE